METLQLRDEFIKLGQALKACGLVESGAQAKLVIGQGLVSVNGSVASQRGKKLYADDVISYQGQTITITGHDH